MKKILFSIICGTLFLAGCKKDDAAPPSSLITGKIVYNKLPLSVRSTGVELELWQYGYSTRIKIPIYVNQDGSYEAKVFDGNYKLTMLRGNGPWAEKTDSIDVALKGSTVIDITVDPYFVISSSTFAKSGNAIAGTVSLQRVNTTRNLESVTLYVGQTMITDQNNSGASVTRAASSITDLTQPISLSANIPAALAGKDYVYARVGVRISGVGEQLYSVPMEIKLK